ncbi:hypothetical protein RvY_02798 [Ramazzottius varieornatus]|uniref:Uncharacterized protein n=1 Tax=Ramazzottius varieornatus TaxID=947166 RepID=A0A1D1UPQ4_RAMVA|nr:hypothetical protein RvY_02798 [Ramazzottius varieornatus]
MTVLAFFFLSLLVCCFTTNVPGNKNLSGKHYGSGQSQSSGTNSSTSGSAGFPTSNKGCFSNIIKNPVPSDFRKKVGVFYVARSKSVNQQVYDAMFTNSLVGKNPLIWLPATTTVSVHVGQNYQHVTMDASGHPVCDRQNLQLLCRLDGVCPLQLFDVMFGATNPLSLVQYSLYNDDSAKGYDIVYICNKLNVKSGICDDPFVYVNTRVRPDKMSAADKTAMENVIDQTLKPYCMTKADLQVTIFRNDIPPCNAAPTADYVSSLAGWDASLAHPEQ